MARHLVLAAAALAFLGPSALAGDDILQLSDGRFIDDVDMALDGEFIVLKYENGDVRVPLARVEDYVVDGESPVDVGDANARAKRREGLVPFRGRWMKPAQRDKLIQKEIKKKREELEDVRAHQEWRDRYKFSTKNFEFESTLPPRLNEEYSALMETYFANFKKLWGVKVPKDWGKLKVCFYHDRDSFNRTAGVSGGVMAYYRFVAPRELDFFYDRRDPESTVSTMFHEANHYLTDLVSEDFQYPHWINEAMAEYWGASKWDPVKKTMTVGDIQDGRLVELKNDIDAGKTIRLESLIGSEARDYNHYYWGWSFVHFMLETPKYAKGFKKFFLDLARAKDVDRKRGAFQFKNVSGKECLKAFKKRLKVKDIGRLEAEWYDYIAKLEPKGTYGLERAGLGAYYNGRMIKASRLLGEAVEAGSTSIPVHLRYASVLQMKPDGREKALEVAVRACELDPLDADCWAAQGYVLHNLGRKDEAKKFVALAREMNPDDPYLAIQIAEALGDAAEEE
jgi:tetratricopeptide (TPR) repeat protein